MSKDRVKEVLDRVLTWPPERQEIAVEMLEGLEAQDDPAVQLTDEQLAEVRRRLADPNPRFLTFAEVRARLAASGA
jgi:hypothetical protein